MEHQEVISALLARDPLLHEAPMPHEALYFPYGFPLRVCTNSERILELAGESWGRFSAWRAEEPLELHVGIAGGAAAFPSEPVVRSRRHLLTISSDAQHFGVCDFEAGFGYCWLTPRVLEDPSFLRYFFLESHGYSLVCERYFTGIHGACVAYNGHGVLLCGASEAGKSTLAYACAKRGWTFICDDGSFLVRASEDHTITGNPYRVRLRPSATALFPELPALQCGLQPNGKRAIELDTVGFRIAPRAAVEHVVFLSRGRGGPASLRPFSREEAFRQMESVICYGRETTREEQRQSLRRLLSLPVLELCYGELDSAVDCLESLLQQGCRL
ncbi:MAG: aldolase [Bryobacterales bacterium]|nr:aldolase [Bryobacterales bacterium]